MNKITLNGNSILVTKHTLPLRKDAETIQIATGNLKLETLVANAEYPGRSPKEQTGYQRPSSPKRITELKTRIEQGKVDLPTAVLFNVRDYEPTDMEMLITVDNNGTSAGLLHLNDKKLWCVDGQHRTRSLIEVYKAASAIEGEEIVGKWADYTIPAIIMLGVSPEVEMETFYVVNTNAKSVETNLAYDLLSEMAKSNANFHDDMVSQNKEWIIAGKELAMKLNTDSSVWGGKIFLTGGERSETTVTMSGFINSLKSLLQHPWFGILERQSQLEVLEAYWGGIKKCIPGAFINAKEFTTQKSLGVYVLHTIFPIVLEIVRSQHGQDALYDPEKYKQVMSDSLEQLEGEDPEDPYKKIKGVEFWRTGDGGAASSYSSGAGRRILINKLRSLLPKITR